MGLCFDIRICSDRHIHVSSLPKAAEPLNWRLLDYSRMSFMICETRSVPWFATSSHEGLDCRNNALTTAGLGRMNLDYSKVVQLDEKKHFDHAEKLTNKMPPVCSIVYVWMLILTCVGDDFHGCFVVICMGRVVLFQTKHHCHFHTCAFAHKIRRLWLIRKVKHTSNSLLWILWFGQTEAPSKRDEKWLWSSGLLH